MMRIIDQDMLRMLRRTDSRYIERTYTSLAGLSIRVPQTRGLKQQKRIASQFWRLGLQDQLAHRVVSL